MKALEFTYNWSLEPFPSAIQLHPTFDHHQRPSSTETNNHGGIRFWTKLVKCYFKHFKTTNSNPKKKQKSNKDSSSTTSTSSNASPRSTNKCYSTTIDGERDEMLKAAILYCKQMNFTGSVTMSSGGEESEEYEVAMNDNVDQSDVSEALLSETNEAKEKVDHVIEGNEEESLQQAGAGHVVFEEDKHSAQAQSLSSNFVGLDDEKQALGCNNVAPWASTQGLNDNSSPLPDGKSKISVGPIFDPSLDFDVRPSKRNTAALRKKKRVAAQSKAGCDQVVTEVSDDDILKMSSGYGRRCCQIVSTSLLGKLNSTRFMCSCLQI